MAVDVSVLDIYIPVLQSFLLQKLYVPGQLSGMQSKEMTPSESRQRTERTRTPPPHVTVHCEKVLISLVIKMQSYSITWDHSDTLQDCITCFLAFGVEYVLHVFLRLQ